MAGSRRTPRRDRRRRLPHRWASVPRRRALLVPVVAVAVVAGLVPLGLTPWSGTHSSDEQAEASPATGVGSGVVAGERADTVGRASRARLDTDLDLPPVPKKLKGLRKAADRASTRLSDATGEWKDARKELKVARARQRNLADRADELSGIASEGRERLGQIAAQTYKNPDAELAVLLDRDEVRGYLRSTSLLDHVERREGEEIARLLERQKQADRLAAQARKLADQVKADAKALDARRDQLREYADKVQRRLDAALERLEEKRRARNPVAGVPGCDPRTGYDQYPNGLIPSDALCPLPPDGHYLRADAAVAFHKLNREYREAFGKDICVTDSYRSLEAQRDLYYRKPGLAAVPGTSNHGFGLAVDVCDGAQSYGTTPHEWLDAHGDEFGWDLPSWARQGGSREEPWHWEYEAD